MLKSNGFMSSLQDRVGKALSFIPLTPNQWTILSFLVALISSYFIIKGQFLQASFFFAIAVLMDAIDGAVARAKGSVTKFGAFLDGLVDRFVETAVLLSFMLLNFSDTFYYFGFLFFLIFGTYMTSFVRAYAHHKGLIDENDCQKMGGLFERGERCILLVFVIVSANFNIMYAVYLAYIGAFLSFLTTIQRIFYVYQRK
ncbi:MAG: CDP-alcohol phosphatidyltransferase family protein [Candidatus Bilamarchaeaceae archaeon]